MEINNISQKYSLLSFVFAKWQLILGVLFLGTVVIIIIEGGDFQLRHLYISLFLFLFTVTKVVFSYFIGNNRKYIFFKSNDNCEVQVDGEKFLLHRVMVSKREKMAIIYFYNKENFINRMFESYSTRNIHFYNLNEVERFVQGCKGEGINVAYFK